MRNVEEFGIENEVNRGKPKYILKKDKLKVEAELDVSPSTVSTRPSLNRIITYDDNRTRSEQWMPKRTSKPSLPTEKELWRLYISSYNLFSARISIE